MRRRRRSGVRGGPPLDRLSPVGGKRSPASAAILLTSSLLLLLLVTAAAAFVVHPSNGVRPRSSSGSGSRWFGGSHPTSPFVPLGESTGRPPLALLRASDRDGDAESDETSAAESPLDRSFRRVAASLLRPPTTGKAPSAGSAAGDGGAELYVDATPAARKADASKGGSAATPTGTADARAINYDIVRRGTAFVERTKSGDPPAAGTDGEGNALSADAERVPGCVANVNVRVAVVPLLAPGDTDASHDDDAVPRAAAGYGVSLDGDADALLSRGLLSLLSEVIAGEGVTAADVLSADGADVADRLGIRSVLSEGRNDGLASMTGVVQGQIRELLGGGSKNVVSVAAAEADEAVSSEIENDDDDDRPTVAMLLSGGVDSSVALHLLLRQNYRVTAFYLRIWLEDELAHLGQCPWEDDYAVCKEVCEQAGVPLEAISLQDQYRDRVISYTVDDARRGRTPNPDVMCNSRIKFGCFYDEIEGRGFDYVASGHYARLEEGAKSPEGTTIMRLHRAPDPVKDQSYFLSALTQPQLQRVIFPLGNMLKTEVRALANEFDLPNRARPDSQGLCFLGKVKFDEFLSVYLGDEPGDIIDAADGRIIGRHRGLWYHTIGQRKGIGPVIDPLESSRGPWYVVAKDPGRNAVIISNRYNEEEAFQRARSDFYVEDITWIGGGVPARLQAVDSNEEGRLWREGHFDIKIRHGPNIVGGTLSLDESVLKGTAGSVSLDTKDKGLAPGQFCVFYDEDGDECLGSGIISERHWATFLADNSADVALQPDLLETTLAVDQT